jgi:CHAT domain-containing protein
LPGTAAELEQLRRVSSHRDVVILRGNQATVQRVLNELPNSRWAHIATHGFFVDPNLNAKLHLAAGQTYLPQLTVNATRESVLSRNPFILSGLVLAQANSPVNSESQDPWQAAPSLLTAESIATIDCSNLELVVLSACETARGDQQPGDGVFGLQCAFHLAGTRNVIASLWKIDDRAAHQLMNAFYQYLWKDNLSPLEALRQAQLDLMEVGGNSAVTRGPRLSTTVRNSTGSELTSYNAVHWAGFVLSGCGQ